MWTNERIQQLTDLWAAGWSISLIASQMGGTSRGAVIGKVHRLNLPPRGRTTFRKRQSRVQRRVHIERSRRILPRDPRAPRVYRAIRRDDPTKNELRAMLTMAARNTAAMPI